MRLSNLEKHGIDFQDSIMTFGNDAPILPSPREGEMRWLAIGRVDGKSLAAAYKKGLLPQEHQPGEHPYGEAAAGPDFCCAKRSEMLTEAVDGQAVPISAGGQLARNLCGAGRRGDRTAVGQRLLPAPQRHAVTQTQARECRLGPANGAGRARRRDPRLYR